MLQNVMNLDMKAKIPTQGEEKPTFLRFEDAKAKREQKCSQPEVDHFAFEKEYECIRGVQWAEGFDEPSLFEFLDFKNYQNFK